jgi:uncharacterized protein YfiM (DUF2279 family)
MGTMHPPERQIRIRALYLEPPKGPKPSAMVRVGQSPPLPTRGHRLALRFAIVVAMLVAAPEVRAGDDLFGRDKALHFAASAGIALGGYGGATLFTDTRPPRLMVGGGLALLAGIGKEIADRYTGGDPSWRDLGWDVVGTATGLTLAYTIDWGWHRLFR